MGEQFPDKTSISFFRLSHLSHKIKIDVFQFVIGEITETRARQAETDFCLTDYKKNK